MARSIALEAGRAVDKPLDEKTPAQCSLLWRAGRLAEDVFHLFKEGRVAIGRTVFHLEHLVQLLQKDTLLACNLGWRNHAHVDVQVAFAPSVRIGQSFALETN